MKYFLLLTLFLFSNSTYASLANPKAKQGGTFKYNLGQEPTTINVLSSTDYYASILQGFVVESLLTKNLETYEYEPNLATEWTISDDGLVYEFTLREGVKWHDGKPFTVEDVKFSLDAILDKDNKYKTAHSKPYFQNISKIEITGKNKIKFTAKKQYFGNFFQVAVGLDIVPKHLYENPSKAQAKKLNKTLVGTGPWVLDKYRRGKSIILKKNKDWWGFKDPTKKGQYNYSKVLMRFIKDGTIAIQRTEKGDIDFLSLSSEEYVKKTNSDKWGKEVFKHKVQNKSPVSYGFIGWNLKNDLFKSKNVRLALYHLLNRDQMIKKFRYGLSLPATGPLYRQSEYADPTVKPVTFNPKKALEMLRKEGWKDTDGDQVLDKKINGKKVNFSFTILEPNNEFMKYLTMFKEDAKKAGIDVKLKYVEWNTFIKLLDERKFEAVRLGWGGGSVDWDPKQIWHSDSAAGAGSNFIGYSNKKVDKLIEEARVTLDQKKRVKLLRQVYKLIAEDAPYAFFFNDKYKFYGQTKRMGNVKDTYEYGVGYDQYWWIK